MKKATLTIIVTLLSILPLDAIAKTVRYELTITRDKVNLSGKKTVEWALMVNGATQMRGRPESLLL